MIRTMNYSVYILYVLCLCVCAHVWAFVCVCVSLCDYVCAHRCVCVCASAQPLHCAMAGVAWTIGIVTGAREEPSTVAVFASHEL